MKTSYRVFDSETKQECQVIAEYNAWCDVCIKCYEVVIGGVTRLFAEKAFRRRFK